MVQLTLAASIAMSSIAMSIGKQKFNVGSEPPLQLGG